MRRNLVGIVVALAALAALAAPARGQEGGKGGKPKPAKEASAADKARAVRLLGEGDKALKRGDKLMAAGDIERALEAYGVGLARYQSAHAAFPSSKIYFPIGQAEQKLGRFMDALGHYEQVLAEGGELSAAVRKQIDDALVEVKKNLGRLDLVAQPSGARISVDGDIVGTAPLEKPIFIEPGRHEIAVTAPDHLEFEEHLELPAGKPVKRTVELKPVPLAKDRPAPVETRPLEASPPSKTGFHVMLGVTGAFAATAAVTGILASRKHGVYEDAGRPGDEREDARSTGKTLAIVTDVMLGGAVVMGGVATFYYYKHYKPRREAWDEEHAAVWPRLTPWVAASGGGMAWSGSF
jgi:hypothetical protein